MRGRPTFQRSQQMIKPANLLFIQLQHLLHHPFLQPRIMYPHTPSPNLLPIQHQIVMLSPDTVHFPGFQVGEIFVHRCGEWVVGGSVSAAGEVDFVLVGEGEERELGDPEKVWLGGEGHQA